MLAKGANVAQLSLLTPLGDLTLSEHNGAIVSLDWGRAPPQFQKQTKLLKKAARQLQDYFDGKRRDFDLPLDPSGTEFQRRVWSALTKIPFGATRTYGELAKSIKSAPRAVGGACGANPIPIIIPCHRILAAEGRLGGYSGDGGARTKEVLLKLERALLV